MDLHRALSALMRPIALPAGVAPNVSALFPSLLADPTLLSRLSKLEAPLGIVPYETPFTPSKKARLDEPSSPSSHSSSTVSSTQFSSPQPSPCRKPAVPIPDEKKDNAYFERRRKNNDAAKRSRDARRHKEEAVAAKASALEQENIQLRGQIALLQQETAKLQLLLFSSRTSVSSMGSDSTDDDSKSEHAI